MLLKRWPKLSLAMRCVGYGKLLNATLTTTGDFMTEEKYYRNSDMLRQKLGELAKDFSDDVAKAHSELSETLTEDIEQATELVAEISQEFTKNVEKATTGGEGTE